MELSPYIQGRIAEYFKRQPVHRAYLFGSFARGEADELSDLDLLVDLDHSQTIGLRFVTMKLELEKLLGLKVDLVSSNGLSRYLKPIIDTEKRLIYEKARR